MRGNGQLVVRRPARRADANTDHSLGLSLATRFTGEQWQQRRREIADWIIKFQ